VPRKQSTNLRELHPNRAPTLRTYVTLERGLQFRNQGGDTHKVGQTTHAHDFRRKYSILALPLSVSR
jgi:hypothetical protein